MSSYTAQTILTTITSNGNRTIQPSTGMYLKEIDITTNVNTNPPIQQTLNTQLENNQQHYTITPANGYDGISTVNIQLLPGINKKITAFSLNYHRITLTNYSDYVSQSGTGWFIAIQFNINTDNICEITNIELINNPSFQTPQILIPARENDINEFHITGPNINQIFFPDTNYNFGITIGLYPWLLITDD